MHCTQWSRELARVGCDVTLTSWQQWRHSVQRCCCYDNGGGCLAEYSANDKRQRHHRCRGTIHVVHYSGQWAGTCPPKTAPSCWGNWTPSNAVMSHFECMLNTCCPALVSYLDTPFLCCLFLGLFLGSSARVVSMYAWLCIQLDIQWRPGPRSAELDWWYRRLGPADLSQRHHGAVCLRQQPSQWSACSVIISLHSFVITCDSWLLCAIQIVLLGGGLLAFSALTLLVGLQEGHPAWVVGCWRGYLSGARCRLAYGPADATATHCLLLQ